MEAVMQNMAAVKQALTNATETGKRKLRKRQLHEQGRTTTEKAAATGKARGKGGQRKLTPLERRL